jgi:hypothetical protein
MIHSDHLTPPVGSYSLHYRALRHRRPLKSNIRRLRRAALVLERATVELFRELVAPLAKDSRIASPGDVRPGSTGMLLGIRFRMSECSFQGFGRGSRAFGRLTHAANRRMSRRSAGQREVRMIQRPTRSWGQVRSTEIGPWRE